ncbi:uncharacterized protein LOC108829554 [Raphanus sativus]|uniref:Uncharacterized protein LOC108829554 n=1 Tax=Raphanus sativus TaxID=3726 RepID=A0A6J0LFQ5_RAPSA|nr:uncharacterized protein LOC108829554 [Raphanus sativus]
MKYCRVRPADASQVRQNAAPAAAVVAPGACFNCGKQGHFARDCTTEPAIKRQAIAPRVYALGETEGVEPTAGSVSVGGEIAHTLFDTGASHSFKKQIITAGTESLGTFGIHREVPVILGGMDFIGDLSEMELDYYDVILGMDWLSRHQVVVDCPRARVLIPREEGNITFQCIQVQRGVSIVSMMRAEDFLERGAEGLLATISVVKDDAHFELQDIPVVEGFEDVFEALEGPPPARDDVLTIELEPGTTPVSRAPYRLAPAEMAELK